MAVYKVPQDVEAEDKLVGPFSFRQFVFLLIMVASLYLAFVLFKALPFLVIIPLPITVFFAALAFPWKKDQPTEVYLTALIHFWTRPRKRIWDNDGLSEHVKITAPKYVDPHYSDGLSNVQVNTRLHSLASTLDSRGWAAKNVSVQDARGMNNFSPMPVQQGYGQIDMPQVVTPVPGAGAVGVNEDVMDFDNNPVAQNFDQLVQKSAMDKKKQLMDQMRQQIDSAPAQQDLPTPMTPQQAVREYDTPSSDGSSATFNPYPNMNQHVIDPNGTNSTSTPQQADEPEKQVAEQPSDAILNLANNSDLNVSTIARQAEAALHDNDTIELH